MGDVGTGGYARVDGGRVECGGPGERAAGLYGGGTGGKRGQSLSTSLHTMSLFLRQKISERTAGSFSPSEVEISSLNIVFDNYSFQN